MNPWINAAFAPALLADEEIVLGIAFFAAAALIAVVTIVATQQRRAREAAYNARLKQLMIERGMSAEEIERVITSGAPKGRSCQSRAHPRRPMEV